MEQQLSLEISDTLSDKRAVSSEGERSLHTREVAGSTPAPPTTDTWMEGRTPVRRLPNGVLIYSGWPIGEPFDQAQMQRYRDEYARLDGYSQDAPQSPIPPAAANAPPLPEPRLRRQGFVYFLHDPGTDWIKIGFTANPGQRLGLLTAGSARKVLAIIPGTMADEKRLHDEFSDFLATGKEWFFRVPQIESRIAKLSERRLPLSPER